MKLINVKNKNYKFFYPYPNLIKLKKFYAQKYFSKSKNYNYKYKKFEENFFKNSSKLTIEFLKLKLKKNFKKLNLLDLGCGNGSFIYSASTYFKSVVGVDFSKKNLSYKLSDNCKYIEADPENFLKKENLNYHIITLNNVLEHVVNPRVFMNNLYKKLTKDQYLVLMIPNDFSKLQKNIKKKNNIRNYWVTYPEHQNYFNDDNFKSFIKNKFKIIDEIGDFPVELFLFVDQMNYIKLPNLGKIIHEFRCKFFNYCFNESIPETINLYKTFKKIGISRNNFYILKKK